jgi:hypothetical protein
MRQARLTEQNAQKRAYDVISTYIFISPISLNLKIC